MKKPTGCNPWALRVSGGLLIALALLLAEVGHLLELVERQFAVAVGVEPRGQGVGPLAALALPLAGLTVGLARRLLDGFTHLGELILVELAVAVGVELLEQLFDAIAALGPALRPLRPGGCVRGDG